MNEDGKATFELYDPFQDDEFKLETLW